MATVNPAHPLQLHPPSALEPTASSTPTMPADDHHEAYSSRENTATNVKDTMGIGLDLVPDSVTIRLRSITCKGVHEETKASFKLQGVTQWSKPTKNLGDHTCEAFEFQTSIHIMSFDSVKIDLFDVNILGQHTRIGRAYLPLRDMVKKVAHRIDSAVDKTIHSSSSSGTLPSPTSPTGTSPSPYTVPLENGGHRDIVQVDLPLFKHGSYSKFGASEHSFHNLGSIFSSHPDDAKKPKQVLVSTGSQPGQKDIEKTIDAPPLARLESYAETVMNGVKVGMLTVEVGLNYKDLSRRTTYYATRLRSKSIDAASTVSTRSTQETKSLNGDAATTGTTTSRRSRRRRRSNAQQTMGATAEQFVADSSALQESYAQLQSSKKVPAPLYIATKESTSALESPPKTPAVPGSPTSPIQPCLSSFPCTTDGQLLEGEGEGCDNPELDKMFSTEPISDYSDDDLDEEEEDDDDDDDDEGTRTGAGAKFRFDDENQYLDGQSHLRDEYKGENLSKADREREEELMAEIMANGDPIKKQQYLDSCHREGHEHTGKKEQQKHQHQQDKGKKFRFQLFSPETRSAFKDIQLLYSSFFGHGWNLTRGEFWKGIRLVEKYYERRPMEITNRFFDDIETLERTRHFVRLAIATYGSLPWLYFGYSYKSTALNFVRLHSDRKNVIDYFKLNKEDMITWHFDKRSALVPSYYIIRDPHTNSLCVIIRGTFSITDAMTDLVCEYYPYKGGLVHKGIMDNARFVFERSKKDIEAALKKFNLERLYCIGHSLGAGSASLLCSLLQDHFQDFVIPAAKSSTGRARRLEVKAYLFAPPPIATLDLARSWEKTQLSIVNENDIVSRLSYGNALDLKEMIKIGALESRNPAYKDLTPQEREEKVLDVLERAQKKLQAIHDIPRLVLPGKVAYLHKVYRSTPVVRSQDSTGSNKFGGNNNSSSISTNSASGSGSSGSSTNDGNGKYGASVSNPWTRSLNTLGAAFQLKSLTKAGTGEIPTTASAVPDASAHQTSSNSNSGGGGGGGRGSNDNADSGRILASKPLVETPLETPSSSTSQKLGSPVQYTHTSDARTQATESILQQSHKDQNRTVLEEKKEEEGGNDDEEEEVLLTKKPTKRDKHHGAQKEIRIEYSDRERFMSIPLRSNWAWHHFPQQYDSRIERALAWAKTRKAEYEQQEQQQSRQGTSS